MKNPSQKKEEIIHIMFSGQFSIESWDFRGGEPSDCKDFVEEWLMNNVTAEMISFDDCDEVPYVSAHEALCAYWDTQDYCIGSAYYTVSVWY